MRSPLLSIVNQGSKRSRVGAGVRNEMERERLLIQRFLALPTAAQGILITPDGRLLHVASVLLNSQITIAQALGRDLCYSPAQLILLLVYVRHGQGRDVSIRTLSTFPGLGPATVALRWAAKLVGDGILEVTEAHEADDRLLRLTSDGACGLEHWLRCIDSGLMTNSHAGFSV
jgi:hypothetical protein